MGRAFLLMDSVASILRSLILPVLFLLFLASVRAEEKVHSPTKVLLLSSELDRESQALFTFLSGQSTIQCELRITNAEDFDRGGIFGYHVYILRDVPAWELTPEQMTDIVRSVRKGAGLIMAGTRRSFDIGGYWGTPLEECLPMRLDRVFRITFERDEFSNIPQAGPFQFAPESRVASRYPFLAANDQADWKRLPSLDEIYIFRGLAKGKIVAVADGFRHPILLAGDFGEGRVLALATNSTWKWADAKPEHYKSFWLGVVQWLSDHSSDRF